MMRLVGLVIGLIALLGPGKVMAQDALQQRLEDIVFLYYESWGREATPEMLQAGVDSVGELLLEGWTIDDIEQVVWRVLNEVKDAAEHSFGELVVEKARIWGRPPWQDNDPASEIPSPEPTPPRVIETPSQPEPVPVVVSEQPSQSVQQPQSVAIVEEPTEVVTQTTAEPANAQVPEPATGETSAPSTLPAKPPARAEVKPSPPPSSSPAEPKVDQAQLAYQRSMQEYQARRAIKSVGAIGSALGFVAAWIEQPANWSRLQEFEYTFWSMFPLFGPILVLTVIDSDSNQVIFDAPGSDTGGTQKDWKNFAIRGLAAQISSFTSLLIFSGAPNDRPLPPPRRTTGRISHAPRPSPQLHAFAVVPDDSGVHFSLQFSF